MPNPTHGTARPNAKLSEKIVACARALYRQGWSIRKLSAYYGVSNYVMHCAITGRFWSHVPNPVPVGLRTRWAWRA